MTNTARAHGLAPDGFRLPDDTRVGRVTLQVSDLARSIAYYERVLGLRLASHTNDRAELAPSGGTPVLVELRARPGARPASRRGVIGLFHFAILLPGRAALGRFLRHALEHDAVSGLSDHAVSEAIYLYDPDGLGIEVYADRPRDRWRLAPGRELYMTTEPLDVGSVIAAGGGDGWDAAPAGTTMGHVHLHVGSLERAEAFYHRALGFDKTVWTYPGALFFAAGGYHHHLGTNTWASRQPAGDDQARLISWDLETADAHGAAASVAAAGYAVTRHADAWSAADPWGTTVRITPLDRDPVLPFARST
jgi:catechol 2,3-dioxygenase